MAHGRLINIFVASEAGAPLRAIEAVRAVPGQGLEGDRYFLQHGSFSRWPGPHREVSLIGEEMLVELERATGIVLKPSETRRNLLVAGVPLNDLVGTIFRIGSVRMQGVRLCQPCKYLARLTGIPDLVPALVNRGGLRARILDEGILRVGDSVHFSDTPT